MNIFNCL